MSTQGWLRAKAGNAPLSLLLCVVACNFSWDPDWVSEQERDGDSGPHSGPPEAGSPPPRIVEAGDDLASWCGAECASARHDAGMCKRAFCADASVCTSVPPCDVCALCIMDGGAPSFTD